MKVMIDIPGYKKEAEYRMPSLGELVVYFPGNVAPVTGPIEYPRIVVEEEVVDWTCEIMVRRMCDAVIIKIDIDFRDCTNESDVIDKARNHLRHSMILSSHPFDWQIKRIVL